MIKPDLGRPNDFLSLEDISAGQRFISRKYELTETEIKAFARQFDPQPFHLDNTAAQASVLRGLAASGWHTASIVDRVDSNCGWHSGCWWDRRLDSARSTW
jgi:acyl dehydratase